MRSQRSAHHALAGTWVLLAAACGNLTSDDDTAKNRVAAGCSIGAPGCPPGNAPAWALKDFQPKSPRFGETYGLEHFQGTVTIAALLAGW